MATPDATTCAACGASGDLHEHHLVPRIHGGTHLPTVLLCISCHGFVHGMTYSLHHADLTRQGLAAAKARGVKLGNPNLKPGKPSADFSKLGRQARSKLSYEHAIEVSPFINAARAAGCKTLCDLARALTAGGIPTPGGKLNIWSAEQVRRVLRRIEKESR